MKCFCMKIPFSANQLMVVSVFIFCPMNKLLEESCDLLFRLSSSVSAGLLMNETLESTATQHTLLNLWPGRLYNVTMVTEAGDLQSSAAIEAQTGREEEEEDRKEGAIRSDV